MSQVKLTGNASGSGSVTIQSPNTNSAYTQTLQALTGTIPSTSGGVALVTGAPIYENTQTVSTSYSITSGSSAMSAGPITLGSGVTVTLPSGSRWVIV
jgi:hypothetical protein